ncbi:unnamed protein product [Caenorhabditis auriculariae]|uniref:Uncharacterized protein n=1 Tax=Caenorhabditis auriculariae TaxID=2777116 RepID=A0A8S1HEX3_9PELO|nr:unnamed protein product [Caenorhabditis auriculariae]
MRRSSGEEFKMSPNEHSPKTERVYANEYFARGAQLSPANMPATNQPAYTFRSEAQRLVRTTTTITASHPASSPEVSNECPLIVFDLAMSLRKNALRRSVGDYDRHALLPFEDKKVVYAVRMQAETTTAVHWGSAVGASVPGTPERLFYLSLLFVSLLCWSAAARGSTDQRRRRHSTDQPNPKPTRKSCQPERTAKHHEYAKTLCGEISPAAGLRKQPRRGWHGPARRSLSTLPSDHQLCRDPEKRPFANGCFSIGKSDKQNEHPMISSYFLFLLPLGVFSAPSNIWLNHGIWSLKEDENWATLSFNFGGATSTSDGFDTTTPSYNDIWTSTYPPNPCYPKAEGSHELKLENPSSKSEAVKEPVTSVNTGRQKYLSTKGPEKNPVDNVPVNLKNICRQNIPIDGDR